MKQNHSSNKKDLYLGANTGVQVMALANMLILIVTVLLMRFVDWRYFTYGFIWWFAVNTLVFYGTFLFPGLVVYNRRKKELMDK